VITGTCQEQHMV